MRKFLRVQAEGNREVSRNLGYYHLAAIILVGYRINSKRAPSTTTHLAGARRSLRTAP
ncbi:MAG: RhuM family protein [Methanoregula sp.]